MSEGPRGPSLQLAPTESPERRGRLGGDGGAGADEADPVATRARGPAEALPQRQRSPSAQAGVLGVRLELGAGLADDGERRRPGEENDRLLERRHATYPAGARSANLA